MGIVKLIGAIVVPSWCHRGAIVLKVTSLNPKAPPDGAHQPNWPIGSSAQPWSAQVSKSASMWLRSPNSRVFVKPSRMSRRRTTGNIGPADLVTGLPTAFDGPSRHQQQSNGRLVDRRCVRTQFDSRISDKAHATGYKLACPRNRVKPGRCLTRRFHFPTIALAGRISATWSSP